MPRDPRNRGDADAQYVQCKHSQLKWETGTMHNTQSQYAMRNVRCASLQCDANVQATCSLRLVAFALWHILMHVHCECEIRDTESASHHNDTINNV